jgi:hypothetical protein
MDTGTLRQRDTFATKIGIGYGGGGAVPQGLTSRLQENC